MPPVTPPIKVLVTGANGYIAIWIVRTLLEKGYSVRGTVRSASKAKHLQEVFKEYGDKHEVVIVEDITKDGAFDEAVKGVDAIEHTASPCHDEADDPDELIIPAVRGTVGILESAMKFGSSVKRIVITSSAATLINPHATPGSTFTEADWGTSSIEQTRKEGRATPNRIKYRASKTLAEQAAWEFVEKNKGKIGWDLVSMIPAYVFGPILHSVAGPSSLNTSTDTWYHTVLKESPPEKRAIGSGWVDVRDLAAAHVLALEKSAAGGERIIVTAGSFIWQEWLDTANALQPPPLGSYVLPKGTPVTGKEVPPYRYDATKAKKVLGLTFRNMEETTRDCMEDFGGRGWVV